MSTTVLQLKGKIIRMLADEILADSSPLAGSQTDASLLLDAIHAALDAISIRIWKPSVFAIEEVGDKFELPTDLIEIEAVRMVTTGAILPRAPFRAGEFLGAIQDNSWMTYPRGYISFLNDLDASGAIIYYSASWTKPAGDNDVIEAPDTCIAALTLFAASHCLLSRAAGSGDVRQYATKVDSGNPTDNPILDLSHAFLKRFEYCLQQIPQMQKGIY